MRLCHFCCCGGKVNFVWIFLLNPNFLLVHRKFSSHSYVSFSCFGMDLKSFSHDCFSKILNIVLCLISKLFKRNNLLIFRTGVSCFSKTLFYSTFLALTRGWVTCRWHPKEFRGPFSIGGSSNKGAIVHTPCGLKLCSPPTDKLQSGFAAADAAPIEQLIFVVLHRWTNRLGCCCSPRLFSLAAALLPSLSFVANIQIKSSLPVIVRLAAAPSSSKLASAVTDLLPGMFYDIW